MNQESIAAMHADPEQRSTALQTVFERARRS